MNTVTAVLLPKFPVQLESHLKWMSDLEPRIQISAKSKQESLKIFVQKILTGSSYPEAVKWSREWRKNVYTMAKLLTRAAMYVCADNFLDPATSLLGQLENSFLDQMESISESQLNVIKYCRDVLWWNIDRTRDHCNEQQTNWEAMMDNDKCQAMIEYLKGILAMNLFVAEYQVLRYFEEAIKLDPKDPISSPVYYESACRHSAWIRWNVFRLVDGRMDTLREDYTEGECLWVKTFLELVPEDPTAMAIYADILRDTILIGSKSEKSREKYLLIFDLLRKAIDAAVEANESPKLIEKFKCLLALRLHTSIYAKAKDLTEEDEELASTLLLECTENVNEETSTYVLAKLGTAYYYKCGTLDRKHECEDLKRAEYFLERALTKGPIYPYSVGGILKVYKLLGYNGNKMLTLVNTALSRVPIRDSLVAHLYTMRGMILWGYKISREEAINNWIFVLKNMKPCYSMIVYEAIKQPTKKVLPRGNSCWTREVMNFLIEKENWGCWSSEKDLVVVQKFIGKLRDQLGNKSIFRR